MTMPKSFDKGPYLQAAIICEKLLVENDGVKSAIRMIDRLTIRGPDPSDQMKPFPYQMTLLIKLKAGWARGVYPLKIQIQKPSGELTQPVVNNILFEGEEDRGVDMGANMLVTITQTGIYWIKVILNDVQLTQIPFRIIYLPQTTPVSGPGQSNPPQV